ncbi:uncharacterized protein LOC142227495 [Haematobia irritans]|uniref:uncharacterized protein LOC142227495 n=1 Tax=Haematobia irritans TaxID=7368 RepID=UPI003F5052EF
MNSAFNFLCLLVVLQIFGSQSISIGQSSEDPVYNYLLEKSLSIKSQEALIYAHSHVKLFQYSIEFFESRQGVEEIDAQTLEFLKRDFMNFKNSIELLEKDKTNCVLQHNVSNQIADLRSRTREHLHKDTEQINYWRKQDKLDQDEVHKNTEAIRASIKSELPQIVEKYKEGLSEKDRQDFEALLAKKPNLFAALHSIYKAKKDAEPVVTYGDDGYCDNYEIDVVLFNLQILS